MVGTIRGLVRMFKLSFTSAVEKWAAGRAGQRHRKCGSKRKRKFAQRDERNRG